MSLGVQGLHQAEKGCMGQVCPESILRWDSSYGIKANVHSENSLPQCPQPPKPLSPFKTVILPGLSPRHSVPALLRDAEDTGVTLSPALLKPAQGWGEKALAEGWAGGAGREAQLSVGAQK